MSAAIEEFARYGLYGTSVDAIAERLSISQPYIFRLFGTKKELFIASVVRVCDRIQTTFAEAARSNPDLPLEAMGRSYSTLLASRSELLVLLHGFAAAQDAEIRQAVAGRYRELWNFVARASGAAEDAVRTFFANGMGMTVGAALGLEEYLDPGHDEHCAG